MKYIFSKYTYLESYMLILFLITLDKLKIVLPYPDPELQTFWNRGSTFKIVGLLVLS
jgi:hypothetical protein